jgi:hypothetical protein
MLQGVTGRFGHPRHRVEETPDRGGHLVRAILVHSMPTALDGQERAPGVRRDQQIRLANSPRVVLITDDQQDWTGDLGQGAQIRLGTAPGTLAELDH